MGGLIGDDFWLLGIIHYGLVDSIELPHGHFLRTTFGSGFQNVQYSCNNHFPRQIPMTKMIHVSHKHLEKVHNLMQPFVTLDGKSR